MEKENIYDLNYSKFLLLVIKYKFHSSACQASHLGATPIQWVSKQDLLLHGRVKITLRGWFLHNRLSLHSKVDSYRRDRSQLETVITCYREKKMINAEAGYQRKLLSIDSKI